MRRFICHAIVLLLLSVSVLPIDVNDAHDRMLLIADVHSYYKTTCIMIVHSDCCTDLNETTVTQIWSRAFSRRGILTTVARFSDLPREARSHQGRVMRPLYVVLLTAKETMNEFATATRQIDISFPFWLVMFLPYRDDPLKTFCQRPTGNPFNLLFNTEMLVACYDTPILNEWYAIRDNRTRLFDLAVWNSTDGLILRTNESLYVRRNNMFGAVMRIAYVELTNEMSRNRDMSRNLDIYLIRNSVPSIADEIEDGQLIYFLGKVMEELSRIGNFTIKMNVQSAYGNWNEEEQAWTGVMGELVADKIDFGVSEFSVTNHRLSVVDFTLPLIVSRNRVYFKKPDGSFVQWSAYFKAFHMNIWMALICMILSVPIVLTLMKTRGRVVLRIMADYYLHIWGIYCQQGLSEFPAEFSLRLAFLSIFVSSLVILSAYAASLISFLTVSIVSLPFSTLEGFARQGSYKLIVFKDSADYDMIVSSNDSVFLHLKKLLKKKQDLPQTTLEGFKQVCSERVGFYIAEVIKNAMKTVPCETVYIDSPKIDNLAMALRKNSPYTEFVNYQLQRFKDNGMLDKLRKMYVVPFSGGENAYPEVTVGSIAPILTILGGGVILGCIVLMLEKMHYKICMNKCGKSCRTVRRLGETVRGVSSREKEYQKKHLPSEQSAAIIYCP